MPKNMKNKNTEKAHSAEEFLKMVGALYPVAHGTLSLVNKRCSSPYCKACREGRGHPSYIFTFRRDGRQHCLHIQPRHAEAVRKAIDNGRMLEEAILNEGPAFIEKLRRED